VLKYGNVRSYGILWISGILRKTGSHCGGLFFCGTISTVFYTF
jgi:hypothetical protein